MVVGVAANRVLPAGSRCQPVSRAQALSEHQAECGGGAKTPCCRRLSAALRPPLRANARPARRLDHFLRHLRKNLVLACSPYFDNPRGVGVSILYNSLRDDLVYRSSGLFLEEEPVEISGKGNRSYAVSLCN